MHYQHVATCKFDAYKLIAYKDIARVLLDFELAFHNGIQMVGCIAQHPVYKNYAAKEDSTVINLKYWRILKPYQNNKGYI